VFLKAYTIFEPFYFILINWYGIKEISINKTTIYNGTQVSCTKFGACEIQKQNVTSFTASNKYVFVDPQTKHTWKAVVIMPLNIKIIVFWVVRPCSLVEAY
jgi:hypothetical protein